MSWLIDLIAGVLTYLRGKLLNLTNALSRATSQALSPLTSKAHAEQGVLRVKLRLLCNHYWTVAFDSSESKYRLVKVRSFETVVIEIQYYTGWTFIILRSRRKFTKPKPITIQISVPIKWNLFLFPHNVSPIYSGHDQAFTFYSMVTFTRE